MKLKPLILAITAAAFIPATLISPALAQSAAMQPREGGYKHLIEFDALKPHAELPKAENTAFIVDSRTTAEHDVGHIGCTANIPDHQFDSHLAKLPQDKSRELIFYCEGPSCDPPHKSAHAAEKHGYTNVKVYNGGLGEWNAKGQPASVSTAFVLKMIENKSDIMLIDARPERRVRQEGMITGAINIPDSMFDKMLDKLPQDKSKEIIYYCQGCACDLSDKSAKKAMALGYKKVRTYAAGHPAWKATMSTGTTPTAAGAAMAQATGAMAAIAIEAGKEKGSISTASFERILKENPTQIAIIDVRDEKDIKKGTFPGAINIPVGEIEKKISELPKGKPIVFTCSTGARSGEAYDTVKMLGDKDIDAYFLDADVSCDGNLCKIKPR